MSGRVTVSDVPSEILSCIFAQALDLDFHPFQYRESLKSAIRTLLNITHVSSRFREVAIYDPHLWNMLHLVNGMHEDLLEAILIRSVPLPFCLSFVEDHTLPSDDETKCWMLVMEHISRLGYLCIEVAEGFEGEYAKAILRLRLPSLRRCIVQFHGLRNVFLNFPPLGGHPSLLQTLDLTNCYFSPTSDGCPGLRSLTIRNLGSLDFSPALGRLGWDLWVNRFAHLRHLVLWSCAASFRNPPGRWKLPSLETLVIVAPARLCASIADCIAYPAHCYCSVTVLFLSTGSCVDAKMGARAAASFLPRGKYKRCRIYANQSVTTIRFLRADRRAVLLSFSLRRLSITVQRSFNNTHQWMDLRDALPSHPSLDALTGCPCHLWEAVSEAFATTVQNVTDLSITIPHNNFSSLTFLPPLLVHMQQLRVLALDPPSLFSSPSISCIAHLNPAMLRLRRLVVIVTEDDWSESMKAGVADFLQSRLDRGTPLREVMFAVSPLVLERMGYAGMDGVSSLLADISRDFPASLSLEWVLRRRVPLMA